MSALACFSLSATKNCSPAVTHSSRPNASTGVDGPAILTKSPKLFVNVLIFPFVVPETTISPTFNLPF